MTEQHLQIFAALYMSDKGPYMTEGERKAVHQFCDSLEEAMREEVTAKNAEKHWQQKIIDKFKKENKRPQNFVTLRGRKTGRTAEWVRPSWMPEHFCPGDNE